jgi:signal transduction histidine kinase
LRNGQELHRLLPYLADLELEVDRLRKQEQFVQHATRTAVRRIRRLCRGDEKTGGELDEIDRTARHLRLVLRDVGELPGYHPAHDQVVAVAVRPLIRRVFRRQQRLQAAPKVALRLELNCDGVEWFPARLHHILDNLISNALKFRDPDKAEPWVQVSVSEGARGYRLMVSDNGVGLAEGERGGVLELFYRAAPERTAGLGVGLAVVKFLVEQSGGTLTVESAAGRGTTFTAHLPRYDLTDFLTGGA